MDEFNFIFLALGFLMTIWSWMSVKKKAPERRYPLWYRGLQLFCMAVILAPCILVTVSEGENQNLSLFLYAQAAAFAILLFWMVQSPGLAEWCPMADAGMEKA